MKLSSIQCWVEAEMTEKIDIVIVDDHPMFRKGLRDVIMSEPEMNVVYEAGDGVEALEAIRHYKPRIALLDLELPKMSGLDVADRIVRDGLPVAIIILTMYNDEDLFNRAMDLGVMGYILKDSAVREIIRGIESVARNEYFLSPSLSKHIVNEHHSIDASLEQRLGLFRLTPAEKRVLRFVARNMTSAQIAEELSISHRTVDHHRENICSKLNLSGKYSLVRFALQYRDYI